MAPLVLPALLATVVACCLAAPVLARRLGRDAGYPLAAVFALATVVLAVTGRRVPEQGPLTVGVDWLPSLGVRAVLRLDGLSLLFALLVLGVGALVLAYSARYLTPDARPARLYTLLTFFAASMLGLVLAGDVVLMFVFWELTTVTSFLLIGGDGGKGSRPALRAFLVTGAGGLALLAGVVLVTVATGTTDLGAILVDPAALQGTAIGGAALWCVLLAAVTKSAQVPFHFWLPDAMVAITPVSAYLHAATMVKAGIYLLARFSPVWSQTTTWTVVLVGLGVVSALYGAVLALRQHDLKALLAYSTVSQLGWLVALLGIGSPLALAAALLHTFSHALFKASLFMLVGIVDREAGSRDVRDLSGLWRMMPVTATTTGLAGLSMAGIPPTMGFLSKEESFIAFLDAGDSAGVVAGVLATVAAAFTAAYGLRIVVDAFAGEPVQKLYEPARLFVAPAALAAGAGLVLGLAAPALSPFFTQVVEDAQLAPKELELSLWHGFTPALGLSALAIAGGVLLFRARRRVDDALHRVPVDVHGADVFDRVHGGLLGLGARVAALPARWQVRDHLTVLLAVPVALAAVGLVGALARGTGVPPARPDLGRPVDVLVVVLAGLALAALARARSRLAAVALVGATGFVLSAWYLVLGAGDVALTQLLVETLTVAVVVLVLRRLPDRRPGRARRRSSGAGPATGLRAGLALGAGLVAGTGTWLLTGRGERSPVGEELLRTAEPLTGGSNVVNTVLVDFRGLDTFGEAVVVGVVALGVAVAARTPAAPGEQASGGEAALGADRGLLVRVLARVLVPVLLVAAVLLLWRGHDEPGGGFISGLVAGAAVVLRRLAGAVPGRDRAAGLVAAGVAVAALTGLAVLAAGGDFLEPVKADVGPLSLTSSLVFDAGIVLVVVALVVAALRALDGRPAAGVEP